LNTDEWLQVLAHGEPPVRDNILASYQAARARQPAAA
jgi:hypothetical protein